MSHENPFAVQLESNTRALEKREIQSNLFLKDKITPKRAREKAVELYILNDLERARLKEADLTQPEKDRLWKIMDDITYPTDPAASRKAHDYMFYLNTSDAIEQIETRINFPTKNVLTIGGSGDFAQLFLRTGSKHIEVCDVSMPGLFWNELKMAALRKLRFDDYQSFFDLENEDSWFHPFLYRIIKKELSTQAQEFFHSWIEHSKDDPDFFDRKPFFLQTREMWSPGGDQYIQTVGSIVKTESAYCGLQKTAERTSVHFRHQDVSHFLRSAKKFDTVYLSNVGYEPEVTSKLAADFLRAGSSRVFFSLSPHRGSTFLQEEGKVMRFIPAQEKPTRHDEKTILDFRLQSIPPTTKEKAMAERIQALVKDGDCKILMPSLEGRVLGWDQRIEFGMIVEATKNNTV